MKQSYRIAALRCVMGLSAIASLLLAGCAKPAATGTQSGAGGSGLKLRIGYGKAAAWTSSGCKRRWKSGLGRRA